MLIVTPRVDLLQAARDLHRQVSEGFTMTRAQAERFARASAPDRLDHFLFTGATSVVLFNLFLVSDRFMVPDVFTLALAIKLFVLTPMILVVVAVGYLLRTWWLAHVPPWVAEAIATLGTIGVSSALGVVMLTTHSPMGAIYHGGLIPVIMFGNLVQRLRFRYALVSTLYALALCIVMMIGIRDLPSPYKMLEIPSTLLLVLVAVYSLVSNFNQEMDERQRFLQADRARILRDQLEQTQTELHAMSRRDPLTGLANRRQFDEFVHGCLPPGCAPRALAVMLIDVDHFKAFNDRYGHPAGDQCLRLVAQSLQQAMATHDGLVARWGGEEFAVVMPDTDAATLLSLGQEMRSRIEALSMRHEASPTASHVTVSCGLACSRTVRDALDAGRLLHQADSALYEAKAQGRNRCVQA